MIKHCSRGRQMGKDLDRISRGVKTKLPVVIVEGKRGPEAPIQTAKLASEVDLARMVIAWCCNLIERWKLVVSLTSCSFETSCLMTCCFLEN